MARYEIGSAELAIMGEKPAGAEILLQLGLDSACGRNGVADLVAAHKWFNLAAMKGNREAARHRQEISREMNREEIAEAQRAAREWLKLH
ncbi:hypothetical protein H2509_12950 [Stappia sp. F7233]|uniref:Sel1 repeat family protein n=1 Tax=Stappia albiluteola TaxID=2758565 RepID=A0A839AEC2_9HYPH|nr:hypothetical protein [Stappia albiluteola]MBA5778033.1 hypothetical protein [Stappia albiluteola]